MCIPEIKQVSKILSPSASTNSRKQDIPMQTLSSSSSTRTAVKTVMKFIGLSICGISFWLLSEAGLQQKGPGGDDDDGDLSQQHSQQVVLLLLAGHLLIDLLLSLNPNDSFRSTEIARAVIEDFWTFVIVVGVLLFTTYYYVNFTKWNPLYMNGILCVLIMNVVSKQFRYSIFNTRKREIKPEQQKSQPLSNDPVSKKMYKIHRADKIDSEPKEAKDPMAWLIHGHEYDLSDFVDRHPGGMESILLGRGRDCTALFESYHAFTSQHRVVLQKYRKQQDGREFKEDIFYNVLRERVKTVLLEKGVDPYSQRGATPLRALYYLLVIASVMVTGYYHIMGSISGSFWFAMAGWLLVALGHDAGHFAVSRKAWVNEWGVWGMSLIVNPVMWQHQHTYSHHSYTNELDHDPDLHHFTQFFLRSHQEVPYTKKYQYQSNWLYVLTAYLLTVYGECINLPFDLSFTGVEYSGALKLQDKDRPGKAIGYRLHFVAYIVIIVIVPIFTNTSIVRGIIAGILHMTTIGLTFAIFSQINHITEDCVMAGMKKRDCPKGGVETNTTLTSVDMKKKAVTVDSWAAAQVETSNNFSAPDSWLWHIVGNGLNLQIEHHLFPGLNHCHLHHIAPIVRKTCEEYGVNYKCAANWTYLWKASLAWYNKLSIDEMTETSTVEKSTTRT